MYPTLPRLPFLPDPLRRIEVPKDLATIEVRGDEVDPATVGMTSDQVERIWKDACSWYRAGVHPALQVCVRREGQVVLDRALGWARPGEPVSTGTPFCVYSASKAITATVLHLLDEQRVLHIGDPVAEYVPEYGRYGKEGITIGHVLAHRAGVAAIPREALAPERIGDREFLVAALCDVKPSSRPGKALAYHASSGGYILDEVVRRATGRTIGEVLRAEILEPHGFRWTDYGVREEDLPLVGESVLTGLPVLPPVSTLLTRALGIGIGELVATTNDARFLSHGAIVPSANTVTNASELARFFDLLMRGELLAPRTLRRALVEQSYMELDGSLGFPTRFAYGYMLGAAVVSLFGLDTEQAFGHLGFTNTLAWADPQRALAASFVTSGKPILYPELPKFLNLGSRITREVPKVG